LLNFRFYKCAVQCASGFRYRTVSFIAPCYHYTTPNARNGFYLSPVFRGIDAKTGNFESFKHSPLICHIFSMNGVRCLISLWKWTEAERMTHLRQRIKGLIFDSAPARTRAGPDSLAVVLSTPPMEGLSWVSTETRRKMIMLGFNLRKAMCSRSYEGWPGFSCCGPLHTAHGRA
ncbi:hypothetical protein COOONC_04207, partial [Cooperia oncophora]